VERIAQALTLCETQASIRETTTRLRVLARELHRNLTNADYDPGSSIDGSAAIRSALRYCRPSPLARLARLRFPVTVNATPRYRVDVIRIISYFS